MHTTHTHKKAEPRHTGSVSTTNAAKVRVSTIMKFFITPVTVFLLMYCAAGKILWLLIIQLKSPPLPQVFSPEGWRTRGGATMLVRVCLVQRCCTLGEWAEQTTIHKEVEPTMSVFQMTPSTTPLIPTPRVIFHTSMAQNTNGRLLVDTITMYLVLFAMLQPDLLKWWFLPKPAALQAGWESTTAIYRARLIFLAINAPSTFVWIKSKSLFMNHVKISMEP